MNLTDRQKQLLVNLVFAVIAFAGSFFGFQQLSSKSGQVGVESYGPLVYLDKGGNRFNVASGGDIEVAAGATEVHAGDAQFRNLTVSTAVNVGGAYVGITPVATATPAYNITATNIAAHSIKVDGTPVFWPTAQTLFLGATAGQHVYCSSQTVRGSATVNPTSIAAAGITTPNAVLTNFGGAHAANPQFVTSANSTGGVTLNTWQQIVGATTTPQAATTDVAIDYCIVGNP